MLKKKDFIIICLVLLLLIESVILAINIRTKEELNKEIEQKEFANHFLGAKMLELTDIMELQKDLLDKKVEEVELLKATVKELK